MDLNDDNSSDVEILDIIDVDFIDLNRNDRTTETTTTDLAELRRIYEDEPDLERLNRPTIVDEEEYDAQCNAKSNGESIDDTIVDQIDVIDLESEESIVELKSPPHCYDEQEELCDFVAEKEVVEKTIEDEVIAILNDVVSQIVNAENNANKNALMATSTTRFVISMDDSSDDEQEENGAKDCEPILPRAPIDVFTLSSDEEEDDQQTNCNEQTISTTNVDKECVNDQQLQREEQQQIAEQTETAGIVTNGNAIKDCDNYQKMNRNPTVEEENLNLNDSDVNIFRTINTTALSHNLKNKSDDINRFQTIFDENIVERHIADKRELNGEEDDDLMIIDECDAKQKLPQKEVISISDDEEDNVTIVSEKQNTRQFTNRNNKSISYYYSHNSPSQFLWQSVICEPSTSSSTSSCSSISSFRSDYNTDRFNRFNNYQCFARNSVITDLKPKNSFKADVKPEPDFASYLTEVRQNSKTNSETIAANTIAVSAPRSAENLEDIVIIADCLKIDINAVRNVVNLLADKCTVPFIARYRRSLILDIDIDHVWQISALYNELIETRDRAKQAETLLRNQNQLTLQIENSLKRCRNVFEVEHLLQFCLKDNEESMQARRLGLTDSAFELLEGKDIDANDYLNLLTVGLHSIKAIEDGWSAIIVDIISKNCDILQFLIATCKTNLPSIEVTVDHEKAKELLYNQQNASHNSSTMIDKYLKFNSFKKPINEINADKLMPIERGEACGVLKVYVDFPIPILNKLMDTCFQKWNLILNELLAKCVRIAWNNYLKPCLTDYIRNELRRKAHTTALDVFRKNVRQLLQEPPLNHTTVIGVDPGSDNCYRVAVVSPCGKPLSHRVVKLDTTPNHDMAAYHLLNLLKENGATIIALGNGYGFRKFEDFLQQRIRSGFFKPFEVHYKIMFDKGLNWYCKSEEAHKEFADFPSYMYRAIAIARRLQNPINILMKCRPKKFDVGMYTNDISDAEVNRVFNEVLVESVSFNGVDINETSADILSKLSGLDADIARIIINKRTSDGHFTSRSQLQDIIELGFKQYEQCIGFIKIMPTANRQQQSCDQYLNELISNKRKNFVSIDDYESFDSTSIHPESYGVANNYLELIGATKDEIGTLSIKQKMLQCFQQFSLQELTEHLNTNMPNMKLIIENLRNKSDSDCRTVANLSDNNIHNRVQYFYELEVGIELKGKVVNVTPIGAFIDCGLNGAITGHLPLSQCGNDALTVNDFVLVSVKSIDKTLQRFRLNFLRKIVK